MAKTQAPYDDGDGASGVVAFTDADGGTVPVGVAAYVEGDVAVPVDADHPLPVALPIGAATEATTAAIAEGIGAPDDAAAGSDTGAWSLVSLVKRGLQALATLVSRVPALVGGRVPVDGSGVTQPVSGPLTNAQLRAADVPVAATLVGQTGTVAVGVSGSVAVTGPLTDAQIRATALPVSGPLTDSQLRASAVPVSGPLTDALLRAAAVPVVEIPGAAVTVNIASGATGSGLVAQSGSLPPGANAWMVLINTPSSGAQTIAFSTEYTDGTSWNPCPAVWASPTRLGVGALVTSQDFHQGVFLTVLRAMSEGRPIRVSFTTAPVAIVVTFTPVFVSTPAVQPVRAATNVLFPVQLNVGPSNLRQRFRRVSDATINAVVISTSTRTLYSLWAANLSASTKYVKVYTKTTAPVPASDVPDFTYPIPLGWSGFLFDSPVGDVFTGLAITITGGIADTDTTAVAAGDVVVNAHYGA